MDGWLDGWTETVIIELTQSSLAGTRLSLAIKPSLSDKGDWIKLIRLSWLDQCD